MGCYLRSIPQQDSCGACRPAGRNIGLLIADHYGRIQIEPVFHGSTLQHAGTRLAALARSAGVRAVISCIQMCALGSEKLLEASVHAKIAAQVTRWA